MLARNLALAVAIAAASLFALPSPAAAQQVARPRYSPVYQPYPSPAYYPWAYGMYGGFGVSYQPFYSMPNFNYPRGGMSTYGPYSYNGPRGYGYGAGGYGGGAPGCY
jgi:hypothetical protein